MDELLSPASVSARGLLDPDETLRIIEATRVGSEDFAMRIYAFLTLEIWCRTFLDRTWTWESLAANQAVPAAL